MVTSTQSASVPATSVLDEIQEAASDASSSAKRAAEATKRAVSKGIYKAAYVSTYGVVFASVFLIELLPHQPRRSDSKQAVRLLENRKRGQSFKLTENNAPGSENSDDRERISIKAPVATKRRAAAFERFS